MNTAKMFWKKADMKALAEHWKYKDKLPYDIRALIPHLMDAYKVWDAAFGNGWVVNALDTIFLETEFIFSDINQWDIEQGVPEWAKDCDTVLLLGVIPYVSDEGLKRFLEQAKDKKIIIRTPCGNGEYVNRFCEELGAEYEAHYRTLSGVLTILMETHRILAPEKVYPIHLESKYGTTQYLIVGKPCV